MHPVVVPDASSQLTAGPAPMLGEANPYVLSEILGLPDEEIKALREAGIVGEALDGAQIPSTVTLDRQVELGWISGYDAFSQKPLANGQGS